jgi:hypothetical protein
MQYNSVRISINSDNSSIRATIFIDNTLYTYSVFTIVNQTSLIPFDGNQEILTINTKLPINLFNPKETIDQFFKLLILQ